jgi:hypothetical protein
LFFYYFSLITSQQNHAQARWATFKNENINTDFYNIYSNYFL